MTDVPLQFQPGVSVKKLRAGSGISLSQVRGAVIIGLEGGGGSGIIGPGDEFVFAGDFAAVDVPSGPQVYPVCASPRFDPQGWLGTDPYESPDWWGGTFPAGSWLALPDGFYIAELTVSWNSGHSGADPAPTTGRIQALFEDVDNRINTPGFDDFYYNAGPTGLFIWAPDQTDHPYVTPVGHEFLRVKDGTGPMAFGMILSQLTDQTPNITVYLQLMRISSVGG